jgi:hypothetical protein
MPILTPLEQLDPARFDTPAILKKLASSSRQLAELKGLAASIPKQGILINTLGLQEAKDSSEIENIVTTHDELCKEDVHAQGVWQPGRQVPGGAGGRGLPGQAEAGTQQLLYVNVTLNAILSPPQAVIR